MLTFSQFEAIINLSNKLIEEQWKEDKMSGNPPQLVPAVLRCALKATEQVLNIEIKELEIKT